MIMGFAHIPLFFRTAFPAIGIVILTGEHTQPSAMLGADLYAQ